MQPKKSLPHELPPRGMTASLLKAAWWLVCYTLGYLFTVQSIRGRGGVVLCHRYLLDVMVDQKRYRYSGPQWVLKFIWHVAPKPDLVILLDAPAEVIQLRKQEVPLEETNRQRQAYRALVAPMPNGQVVDASQPLEDVIADVNQVLVKFLNERIICGDRL
jgi:thymidylate kinase